MIRAWSTVLVAWLPSVTERYGSCRALMTEAQFGRLEGAWRAPETLGDLACNAAIDLPSSAASRSERDVWSGASAAAAAAFPSTIATLIERSPTGPICAWC